MPSLSQKDLDLLLAYLLPIAFHIAGNTVIGSRVSTYLSSTQNLHAVKVLQPQDGRQRHHYR
jgi:hypothetical protein